MPYVSIGELSSGGYVPDQPSYNLPPNIFNEVEDVLITPEGIQPIIEDVGLFAGVLDNPRLLTLVKTGAGTSSWVYLSQTDMYVVFEGLHSKITRLAADGGQYAATDLLGWNQAILHGIPIFNNGIDIPQQLDPNSITSPAKNLANYPATLHADAIRPHKNFLIALSIQSAGGAYDQQSLIWSSPADPGSVPTSWDYTDPASQAGLYTFSETDDRIIDGLSLGDAFVIYKEHTIYQMRFIGGTFIFAIKKQPGHVGLLAPDCVVNFQGGHFFVGKSDVYIYTGQGLPKSVGVGRISQDLFKTINGDHLSNIFVKHNVAEKSIYIYYPSGVSVWANKALIWRYDLNIWSLRNVPQVVDADFGIVDAAVSTSWDSVKDSWANQFNIPWLGKIQKWGDKKSWDANFSGSIWDVVGVKPALETMVMATRLTTSRIYDPLTNISTSDGVTWAGQGAYPPFWNTPLDGNRKKGRLLKKGLAIVGQDVEGRVEVNRSIRKILTEFYPEVVGDSVQVRFGIQEQANGVISWHPFTSFDPAGDLKLDPFISGKFLAFEVEGSGAGLGDWLFTGYGMEINLGGRY